MCVLYTERLRRQPESVWMRVDLSRERNIFGPYIMYKFLFFFFFLFLSISSRRRMHIYIIIIIIYSRRDGTEI